MSLEDKIQKLQALKLRLLDVFLSEAEPASWPPGNKGARDRGDRVWYKKNAMQTISIVRAIDGVLGIHARPVDPDPEGDGPAPNAGTVAAATADAAEDLESQILAAERAASQVIRNMTGGDGGGTKPTKRQRPPKG